MKDICQHKQQKPMPQIAHFTASNEEKLRYLKQMLQSLDMSALSEADRRQLLLQMNMNTDASQLN